MTSAEVRRWLPPLVAYRVGLSLFVLLSVALLPSVDVVAALKAKLPSTADEPSGLRSVWQTWDADIYLKLARNGYGDPDLVGLSAGYWPLWPWSIRIAAPLFGGDDLLAALVLANLFAVAAVLLLLRYVRGGSSWNCGESAALLFLAYPSALFLAFPYSEALFIALALACFVGLAERRYALAATTALLLPLTRAVGVCIALPLAYHVFERWRLRERLGFRHVATLAAPVVGVGLYLLQMTIATGSPWSGFQAQSYIIAQPSLGKLFDLVGFARAFVNANELHGYLDSAFDRALFVLFAASLVPLWRRDRTAFFYALPVGLVPAMTLSFMSFNRHLLAVFPLFLVGGTLLDTPRGRPWKWLVLAACFAFQLLLLLRHVNHLWVG